MSPKASPIGKMSRLVEDDGEAGRFRPKLVETGSEDFDLPVFTSGPGLAYGSRVNLKALSASFTFKITFVRNCRSGSCECFLCRVAPVT